MTVPWELIVCFGLGLVVLYLIGWLLLAPMGFLWRVMAGALLGALCLWVINQFAPLTGFQAPLNPFSALIVGFLGLPGAILVAAFTFLF